MNRFLLFLLCLLPCCALAQPPAVAEIKPRPLITQCASLPAGKSPAVAKAIEALKDKDAKVREAAARGLGAPCDSRAVEPLIAALKDEEPLVRVAAVEALGQLGSPDALDFLDEMVYDKDWRVRWALVGTLGSYKAFHPRNTMVNGIANPNGVDITDPDDMRVRCVAILTAQQITDVAHSRKSLLFLYGFQKSKHEPIRQLAEQAMYEMKNTRNGGNELIGILKNDHNLVLRVWAAEWLGKLKLEKARRALTDAAAEDPEDIVQRAAAEALKALGTAP